MAMLFDGSRIGAEDLARFSVYPLPERLARMAAAAAFRPVTSAQRT